MTFFLIWQETAWVGLLDPQFLPAPLQVMGETYRLLIKGPLAIDILQSVKRVVVGFFLAGVVGIGLGILCGLRKSVYAFLAPIIELFRPIPPPAWIPLAILWFGLGDMPAMFLVFLAAFFPIFTSAYLGVCSLELIQRRAALTLGATRRLFVTDILWPVALPTIFSGLKTGLGIGWMVVITAEVVGAQSGLGYMIQLHRIALDIPGVIVGMVTIGCIGFAMNAGVDALEQRVIPWRR